MKNRIFDLLDFQFEEKAAKEFLSEIAFFTEKNSKARRITGRIRGDEIVERPKASSQQQYLSSVPVRANALPEGTEREDTNEYEEVTIPGVKRRQVSETPVQITEFEEWIRPTFKGYKHLNRIQSIVFPSAFKSNENLLVCAPTGNFKPKLGAGKTDIAMLTVLRTISQHRENLKDFKIIYVAPMKALAAEIVSKFSSRLSHLKIKVRELTGDMQMTKAEINETQMIVTTPEKWDVVTRKSVGDTQLVQKVKLLIMDEVHLLHDERGAVIESLIARTLRLVESSQTMIRIVGLSATLPNYKDVAEFLGVNEKGLFFFDASYRPIPLEQHFIGIKGKANSHVYKTKLDVICYEKVSALLSENHQVMIFVHSRKNTVNSGNSLLNEALACGQLEMFDSTQHDQYSVYLPQVMKSRNKELKELYPKGIGIHHAGMLRSDRTLTEKLFEKGILKVLCCTATLAWGVNLPAYAVVIKGTSLYDSDKGAFVDVSILDVLQIFGRAGRPQFEDRGVGYILTSHDKLTHYVSSMTSQNPIESSFGNNLVNNLNAEIALGTVTTMDEAVKWLSYTYLYVRMKKNPMAYGIDWNIIANDPLLIGRRRELLEIAAAKLHKNQMIVYNPVTGLVTSKDLGRIASNFYISCDTVETINKMMKPYMTEADILSMASLSSEFENINARQEELSELKKLSNTGVVCAIKGGIDTSHGKTNVLLQSYISKSHIEDFALISDCWYVAQNSSRIFRALFEIALSRNWGPTASVLLELCKSVDKRIWGFQHPLAQFELKDDLLKKVEKLSNDMTMEVMRDMSGKEIGELLRNVKMGDTISRYVHQFPILNLKADIFPITRSILKISLEIIPDFKWFEKMHGLSEPFYIWVEDSENEGILYSEYLLVNKSQIGQIIKLGITVPIPESKSTTDGLPAQIYIRAVSDRWIGSETILPISFKHLILPEQNRAPHTNLLDLQPLSISALEDPVLEQICGSRFQYFNPVQTQVFHTVYHTKENILLGAPTGSGKTLIAELALWSAFRDFPKMKVVYIAPLKALVRERVQDWKKRLMPLMGRNLCELTGDVTPDLQTIQNADVIITTPEKWDGVTRSWRTLKYVTDVSCIIVDEIHLLGGDRGPILEIIVSRMNYISSQRESKIRIVGLSTALANANDLADWLGIRHVGLFNFRHSVRPVPLEIYIEGHPGKNYCPRMIAMNKPTYSAIMTHSPTKPVIVFVSSRRQTRLTAQDFISLCANDDNPKRFLHMADVQMDQLLTQIKDPALKLCLQFGIGIHHAGVVASDRQIVEELFCNEKIQILIATSTLAWGVNFPAHLVVVKGTEFYDAKIKGYKDFPITDVLQMMGRAGRPQYDDTGVAVVMVHDVKKNFYKKFLHEPFPVESSMHEYLKEHLNAEIAGGTIKTKQDAMDFITWSYLFRRVSRNPTFYGCLDQSEQSVNQYLSDLIENSLLDLENAECIYIDGNEVSPSPLGSIASKYYLKYTTMETFRNSLKQSFRFAATPDAPFGDFPKLLQALSKASEFDELPVRHNEDVLNRELEMQLPIPVLSGFETPGIDIYLDPHVKTFLLLQSHFSRSVLRIADYVTDTISVLDNTIRINQAMIDFALLKGGSCLVLGLMSLLQCIKQGLWNTDSPLLQLPHVTMENIKITEEKRKIAILQKFSKNELQSSFEGINSHQSAQIFSYLKTIPSPNVDITVLGGKEKEGRWFISKTSKSISLECKIKTGSSSRSNLIQVNLPRFPKPQAEGWFVVISHDSYDRVLAMKRLLSSPFMKTKLEFNLSEDSIGDLDLNFRLISDCYMGIDMQLKVSITLIE